MPIEMRERAVEAIFASCVDATFFEVEPARSQILSSFAAGLDACETVIDVPHVCWYLRPLARPPHRTGEENVMQPFRRSLVGVLAVLLTTTSAWAQLSTAQLSGRIADESGAVLPGVTVTVTQTATGLTRSVTTDEKGTYVLPNLPTGPYRLEAALQGFARTRRPGSFCRWRQRRPSTWCWRLAPSTKRCRSRRLRRSST